MQISVIDVGQATTLTSSNGRSYQQIEVTYKDDSGKVATKKLMSFGNPTVFKTAQTWNKGDAVQIQAVKNDKGYWDWIGFGEGGDTPVQQPQTQSYSNKPATKVTGSNYETKEERAARQVMIVRQSSISSAVSALTANNNVPKVDQILIMAKAFEDFVMGNDSLIIDKQDGGFDNFKDDVPF